MAPTDRYRLWIARQTAKGAIPAAPQYRFDPTAADLGVTRETSNREEMGQGRDDGDPQVTRQATSGGFTVLARPTLLGLLYFGALGSNATTGTPGATAGTFVAPYSHKASAADDQPYYTIWSRMFDGAQAINMRYSDIKLAGLNLTGSPGGDLSCQVPVVGGAHKRLTEAEMASILTGGTYVSDLPLRVPEREITVPGSKSAAISEFGVNLQAAINTQQTNKLYDEYQEPGNRSVEITWTEVYETMELYNRVHFGDPAGVEASAKISYAPLSMAFKNEEGVTGLLIEVPRFAYLGAGLTPNANGEIATYSVSGRASRPKDAQGQYTGGPVMHATSTNATASYAA